MTRALDAVHYCACGCGREVLSPRARYYSGRCRLKVSRERNSPVLAVCDRKLLREAAGKLKPVDAVLAAEVERIARGGQLPLRLNSQRRAKRAAARGEIRAGAIAAA